MDKKPMKVKVKKLRKDAVIPKYALDGDAGMDVVALSKEVKENFIEYRTGLSFEIPKGFVMFIFPRSSVSNVDMALANSVGVLDSGYRGELILRFRKQGYKEYNSGEKVCQIIILPHPFVEFEEVEKLSETERGGGSFGSTDNNNQI